jgi:hypothetical protein
MCWYSAEHAEKVSQAEAGQRLALRKVHGFTWAVRECEVEVRRPEPVCLIDGTKVLFRLSQDQQSELQLPAEIAATFRMRSSPKRDVFEFANGWIAEANRMSPGLLFDVMIIPGREHLSKALSNISENREDESVPARSMESRQHSFLKRLLEFV